MRTLLIGPQAHADLPSWPSPPITVPVLLGLLAPPLLSRHCYCHQALPLLLARPVPCSCSCSCTCTCTAISPFFVDHWHSTRARLKRSGPLPPDVDSILWPSPLPNQPAIYIDGAPFR